MKKALVICLILIIGFGVALSLSVAPYNSLLEEEQALLIELEKEREIHRELDRERLRHGTDAYIEEQARDKFGFVFPEEIVYLNINE